MNFLADIRQDRLIRQSLEKHNFVWFGDVDQHSDEHDIILGLTSSVSHKDTHYAVGSHEELDMRFTRRHEGADTWYILAVSLRSDAPAFVISDAHNPKLLEHLRTHEMPLLNYSPEFSSRYRIEGSTSDFATLEEAFLTPKVARELATHLWPQQVQFDGRTLYLYARQFDEHTLPAMLRSATWIATILQR